MCMGRATVRSDSLVHKIPSNAESTGRLPMGQPPGKGIIASRHLASSNAPLSKKRLSFSQLFDNRFVCFQYFCTNTNTLFFWSISKKIPISFIILHNAITSDSGGTAFMTHFFLCEQCRRQYRQYSIFAATHRNISF